MLSTRIGASGEVIVAFRFASLLLVFAMFPGMLYGEKKEGEGELRSVRMMIRNEADRAKVERLTPAQRDDYGSYVVVRMGEQAMRRARNAGLDLEILEENIGLGTFQFDPKRGAPSIPARFADHEQGPEPRYYLVQFRAPIRDEWIASVKQKGIETLQYVPDNALLVRATPAQIAVASKDNDIRWSGLYHPAYKIADDLAWLLGKPIQKTQAERQRYRVGVFKGNDIGEITSAIAQLGGRVVQVDEHEALYFRTLIIEVDTEKVPEVTALREVARIETWYPDVKEDERSNQVAAGNVNGTTVTATGYASFLISRGVNGTGIAVGVVDDGVDATEMHLTGRVTDNATIRRGAAAGADGHGHHDAGIVAGQCTHTDSGGFFYASGMAPQAHIINIPYLRSGYASGDTVAQGDIVATTAGNGSPGTISTNSWGAGITPSYGTREATYDALVHDASSSMQGQQPLAIIFSAGNSGPSASTITSPKAAKNILVVGASENYRPSQTSSVCNGTAIAQNVDEMACFSSRGPTTDTRIRPDVVVPGTWVASALSGPDTLWGNIDANHRYSSGTSQAAPHVAGATALIQQWWKANNGGQLPAPALSKAMIINGASEMSPASNDPGTVPNNTEGWGRVNLSRVIATGVPTMYNNQANVLTNAGETFNLSGTVSTGSEPFRVTLVWSDAPGAAGANPAIVNNLDLEVTINGNTYKGNVFTSGVSTTGGTADNRNNVEAVYFPAGAATGPFSVTVRLTSVGGDGAQGTGDTTDQHFALVVYNGTSCSSPSAPAATAAANGANRIDVSWTPMPNATNYRILRSTTQGSGYVQVGLQSAVPFADTNVSAFSTYYYVVRAIGPNCESGNSNEVSATATGTLAPPTNVTALLTSPAQVTLNWTGAQGALHYNVYRTTNNASYTLLGSPTATTFVDNTVTGNIAYFYKIRSVNGGVQSNDTPTSVALATIVQFTDDPLPADSLVKATHTTELRNAVNLVRVLSNPAGGPFNFTDTLLANTVQKLHFDQMRNVLNTARTTLGLPAFAFTDPTITAGSTIIRRAHITELREAAGAKFLPPPVVSQLLLNPGFESGAVAWVGTPGVFDNDAATARTGTWKVWMNGYATTHTDTLEQQVAIPAAATEATLTFWLHIVTDESPTSTTMWDQLKIQIRDLSNNVLATLATYSNINHNSGYEQRTFNVLAYKGQTVKVYFLGTEDSSLATSFYIDDTALTVTQPGS